MNTNEYQDWANGEWDVQMANNQFMSSGDKLYFTELMTIEVLKDGAANPTVWGKDCEVQADGLHGITDADGTPFVVEQLASGELVCRFVDTSYQTLVNAGLSAGLGAIIGAAAGAVTGHPLAGAMIGAASGLGGSLLTTARIQLADNDSTNSGSSATWIAEDGRSGNLQLAPQAVRAAGA